MVITEYTVFADIKYSKYNFLLVFLFVFSMNYKTILAYIYFTLRIILCWCIFDIVYFSLIVILCHPILPLQEREPKGVVVEDEITNPSIIPFNRVEEDRIKKRLMEEERQREYQQMKAKVSCSLVTQLLSDLCTCM